MQERLQKILSARGVASRRAAEEMIKAGRVKVNGKAAELGQSADADRDRITVDGKPIALATEKTYIMLNKPRGYVTTLSDAHGRPTVAGLVGEAGIRLYPVGRLDMNSEGLLLMTNDGDAAYRLAHPKYEIKKTYYVTVEGTELDAAASQMAEIRSVDGARVRPAEVNVLERSESGGRLSVTIGEGRKRQVRRLCAYCGLKVRRLVRVSEGELKLGGLRSGEWRYLNEAEMQYLRNIRVIN